MCISFPSKEQVSFNFMAAVTVCSYFGAQEDKIYHCFHFFPIYLPWSDGTMITSFFNAMILAFFILSFKPVFFFFYTPLSPSSGGSLVPLHFLPLEWYHLHIWGCWYFSRQSWFQAVLHPARHLAWYTLHMSKISRATIHRLDVLHSKFQTRHVQF